MAVCEVCNREMLEAAGCVGLPIELADGTKLPPIPFGATEGDGIAGDTCGDCGAHWGGFHHPGCDLERCPKCGGQLISCPCQGDDDEAEQSTKAPAEAPRAVPECDGARLQRLVEGILIELAEIKHRLTVADERTDNIEADLVQLSEAVDRMKAETR